MDTPHTTTSSSWPHCPVHTLPLAAFLLRDAQGQGSIDAWICPLLSEHRHESTEEQAPAGGSTEPMLRFLQEHPGIFSKYHTAMQREKELSKTEDTSTEILPHMPDFTPEQLHRLAHDLAQVEQEQETHRFPATRRRRLHRRLRPDWFRWLRRRR